MIRLGFTGTRHGVSAAQLRAVGRVIDEYYDAGFVAHHGDCVGADAEFHAACRDYEARSIEGHPPDDDKLRAFCGCDVLHDPLPYMARNRIIVASSDVVIAAPYEMAEQPRGGTWSTWRMAKATGKIVRLVMRDGTVS